MTWTEKEWREAIEGSRKNRGERCKFCDVAYKVKPTGYYFSCDYCPLGFYSGSEKSLKLKGHCDPWYHGEYDARSRSGTRGRWIFWTEFALSNPQLKVKM